MPHHLFALDAVALLRQAPLLLLVLALLGRLHALRGHQLGVADLLKVLLVRAHGRQLLLLQHLHQALLQHLAHQHLEDGFHLKVKVKQVACAADTQDHATKL